MPETMVRSQIEAHARAGARRGPRAPVGLALAVGLLCGASGPAVATPRQPDAAELLRRIERLGVVGSVLYVAAHPDDENTRLLAYLGGGRLLRTAYLSLTRGDGGQNLTGPEQGALLGLIRTQELLAARRVDGAEQIFTRVRDFGYSKSAVETLRIWGREAALADVVWAIRRFRPDVIITRFPPAGFETHGQHTASALLALEGFRAAADPRAFPEQLQHVAVWQARRIVVNKPIWNVPPGQDMSRYLQIDTGVYDPVRGASFTEVAAVARTMHKSQGFGVAATRGPALEYFEPLAGAPAARDLFEGVDLTWGRVPGAARVAELFAEARRRFDVRHPEASLPTLVAARAALRGLAAGPWPAHKLDELDDVIAACAGLHLEVRAAEHAVTPGGRLALQAVALNRAPAAVTLEEIRFPTGVVATVGRPLAPHAPQQVERTVTVPREAPFTSPYWLEAPAAEGRYAVADQRLVGVPESPPALAAEFVLRVGAERLVWRRPVVHVWVDPVAGERSRPLEIVPPVSVTPAAAVQMFPSAAPRPLVVTVRAGRADVAGTVKLELPAGFTATPAAAPFRLARLGAEAEVRFTVRPTAAAGGGTLRVVAEVDGARLTRALQRLEYAHLPIVTYQPPAEVALRRFDLRRGPPRVGYIAGAGDEVPEALGQVGFEVTMLDDAALARAPLGRYGAIVVGVRAYNTNPRLPQHHQRLMDYVKAGGTLVVQYNTNNRLAPLKARIGPYPFQISQDRVTDENAAVSFIAPGHRLLTRPNRITAADFDGWVQERGLYFASTWSREYETVLSLHDPGEAPKAGGLLVARHGKGAFIYTGLAFFRQLPAGVPGAYRLFANLLAHGR